MPISLDIKNALRNSTIYIAFYGKIILIPKISDYAFISNVFQNGT